MAAFAPTVATARQYLYGGLVWGTLAQLWLLALLAFFWRGRRARAPGLLFAELLVALLPFDFYLGWWRERAFGFQHLSLAAWLGQWALSSLLTWIAATAVATIAFFWLRRRGPAWWLRLWIILAVAVVFAVAIQPIFIAPLFNHFTPVRDTALRADLERLAARAGIPHAQILQVDASRQSAHTNAYVVGILGSQRIVIYDTLLADQTRAEIEFTVGHEIGHYVLDHLWKGIAFTLALLLGLFTLLGWLFPRLARGRPPSDVATLPLMLLILLALLFLAAPATNGFSRWEEHRADAYGLALSWQAGAAVAGFEREERTDLIYPDPPAWIVFWFFNHPSQQQRIAFARSYPARAAATP
ncbi:MAG: M48 family metalloprotease [Terriglobales bacterium]